MFRFETMKALSNCFTLCGFPRNCSNVCHFYSSRLRYTSQASSGLKGTRDLQIQGITLASSIPKMIRGLLL